MKLEKQLCSLELAKKLKALGVKQDSHFKWLNTPTRGWMTFPRTIAGNEENYSAFSVAELGEMLPSMTISYHQTLGEWSCKYPETEHVIKMEMTEADARAKMLIYLLENKLIQPNS